MSDKNDVNNKRTKKVTKLGKFAKDATKAGVKAGRDVSKKIKDTIEEVSEELKEEREKVKHVKTEPQKAPKFSSRMESHNILSPEGIEQQIYSWYGWFWSVIAYVFIIMISFIISSADNRFKFLPIVLSIGFPFYLFYAMINSIPEIKIGRWVVFSRKDVSLRQQLSFGKAITKAFSTEMIKNSPVGALIIGLFLILLLWVIISPFIG